MDPERRRVVLWGMGLGAVLLVFGYLTADQWMGLLRLLIGG